MPTSPEKAFASIAQRIFPDAVLQASYPLTGGVSAAVYGLDLSDAGNPKQLVLRSHGAADWKPLAKHVTQSEFQLLSALHEEHFPVPKPLLLDLSAQLFPASFFVMERVRGSTEIKAEFRDSALQQMAGFLARLHALDNQAISLPLLPQREDPIAGLLKYLPTVPSLAQLSEGIASYRLQPARVSLLHGDFWPGNLLWAEGQLAAVLDWEDAAWGAPESDLACCRAELNAVFEPQEVEYFTQIYLELTQTNLADLALWDLYVGLAALSSMSNWGLPAEVEAQRRERTLEFVQAAAETLLKTV